MNLTLTQARKSRRDPKYHIVRSHDSLYMLLPGEYMFQVEESDNFGYKTLTPNFWRGLSRTAIRRMFKSPKLRGKVGQYNFDRTNERAGDGRISIGCQVFVGDNIKGLKRWAGLNV